MKVLMVVSLFMVGCAPRWGDYWHLDAEVIDVIREASMPEAESPYIYDDTITTDAVVAD